MQVSNATFGMITGLFLGLVMSFAISFVLLMINLGPIPGFIPIWLGGAATGFLISIPISLVVFPLINLGLRQVLEVRE